jgi:hypothetical protein
VIGNAATCKIRPDCIQFVLSALSKGALAATIQGVWITNAEARLGNRLHDGLESCESAFISTFKAF